MSSQPQDYRNKVILSALLAPVFGGAIIYYSLRKDSIDMANTGNRWSFIALVFWIPAVLGLRSAGIEVPTFVFGVVGVAGMILAVMTVANIKKCMRRSSQDTAV